MKYREEKRNPTLSCLPQTGECWVLGNPMCSIRPTYHTSTKVNLVLFQREPQVFSATVGGKPATRTLDLLREAIVIDIKILHNILSNDESELYTPKDIGVKCAKVALKCFLEETKVLEKDNAHNYNITDTIHRIQRNVEAGWRQLAEGDIGQPSECLQCESYEVQTTGVFLERMVEFVQFAFRDNVFERH